MLPIIQDENKKQQLQQFLGLYDNKDIKENKHEDEEYKGFHEDYENSQSML